jgi:hypothetical protein
MDKKCPLTGVAGDRFTYYALRGKDLIHLGHNVHEPTIEEDQSVIQYWKINMDDRTDAYTMLTGAFVLGADPGRIAELVRYWNITDSDVEGYCAVAGLKYMKVQDVWSVQGAPAARTLFMAVMNYMNQKVNG